MRNTLFAAAALNLSVAPAFLPAAQGVRELAGLPRGEDPLYLSTIGMFVLIFGLGYLWSAASGRVDRIFIGVAAMGKLSVVALLLGFWALGSLPARAALTGIPDLIFGLLFVRWLWRVAGP